LTWSLSAEAHRDHPASVPLAASLQIAGLADKPIGLISIAVRTAILRRQEPILLAMILFCSILFSRVPLSRLRHPPPWTAVPPKRISAMTVIVQRPGEMPETYESYRLAAHARACHDMLVRSEPFWQVWLDGQT
jgi:hypothetical protein